MKIAERYYHRTNKEHIYPHKNLIGDIELAIDSCPHKFQQGATGDIKEHFDIVLNSRGWVNNVRIDPSLNSSINFMKTDVAFVIQLGNIARFYADVLKLTTLMQKGITKLGVLAVACNSEAILLGANYANYERVARELKVFDQILSYPIFVIGLSN